MNLNDLLVAIKNRFKSDKPMLQYLPGTRNATPIGIRDSGLYNEAEEKATRLKMARQNHYAEMGPTYDPSGKYLCKDCKFRVPTDLDKYNALCSKVDGAVSLLTGSCDLFAFGQYSADNKLLSIVDAPIFHGAGLMTKEDSGYQERPTSKGFGCMRCEHGRKAKYQDKDFRSMWCRRFGTHVSATACCSEHIGIDSINNFNS